MQVLKYIMIIAIALLFTTSCNEGTARRCGQEPGIQSEIVKIKYGTSFGFCAGYCWKQLAINSDNIESQKMSREENEPINCDRDVDCVEWLPLTQIDVEKFFGMDEIIGCPDCTDGGAEWIEIQTRTAKHKVTFDHMTPPAEINNYVIILRELMTTFDNCN